MRFAFIQPEKSIIDHIELVLLELNKIPLTLNGEIKEILLNTITKIRQIQEKYYHLESNKSVPELMEIWKNITEKQKKCMNDVNKFYKYAKNIAYKFKPKGTREETMSNFITNIAAERDGGRSQRTVLRDPTNNQAVQQALRNQEDAVNLFIETLNLLDEEIPSVNAIINEILDFWCEFDRHMEKFKKEQEEKDDRFTELNDIISETIKKLLVKQMGAKVVPTNNYGLAALIDEILFGQKVFFRRFTKTVIAFNDAMRTFCLIAPDEELPATLKPVKNLSMPTLRSRNSARTSDAAMFPQKQKNKTVCEPLKLRAASLKID